MGKAIHNFGRETGSFGEVYRDFAIPTQTSPNHPSHRSSSSKLSHLLSLTSSLNLFNSSLFARRQTSSLTVAHPVPLHVRKPPKALLCPEPTLSTQESLNDNNTNHIYSPQMVGSKCVTHEGKEIGTARWWFLSPLSRRPLLPLSRRLYFLVAA
ncbi:hypothetical protein GALMADRAFT_1294094 [Galerina marginata CBS 339.88]|uniref:Uncharacterized protein n=1 Tax=Galerina marginata (strain CBS 339.88) TaxID=685588 RepID=A0A067TDI3_GALM3|nr:hypothetical protein GALMADRAFT_1294094 [Galerina marginata CBS 339.88]